MAHKEPISMSARVMRNGLQRLHDLMDEPGEGARRVRITNSAGLVCLMSDARRRDANRQASLQMLDTIDPGGVHILAFQFLHNDIEWRTHWLVKACEGMKPLSLWLDVSMEALNDFSVEVWRMPPANAAEGEA